MKILTTVKKVVDVELTIHVKDGAIVEDGLQYVINAWDENAVETAVRLKEKNGAETTLVSVGGGDNTDMIRKCYAMGIENGIHIDDPALEKADAAIYARVLQKVYEKGNYDLVITGKQAQDTDAGQTGIILAEYLGLPCVSNVIGVEVVDDQHLKVSRAGDAGTEIVELTLPAVITVDVSINEPRLPQMRGIMMAKKKPINKMDLAALGTSPDEIGAAAPKSEVIEFMASKTRKAGQKFEGDAAEITAKVVQLLADEAKVL
ncbi:electron transfer flavoprotein subunit beta/FixA family protein [Desulfococcus multivorans]|uniref:Electron transfer flavoprotein alpha/beta-subunit n=1 Tax=Desulfococcus multivorans DSM 2059 TaxID=1121405 RepID=S7TTR5_DESML|nr:electron transfer flavoprotein subunit beta/FixA family protein [Desulfococcus multivorans]AOY59220.1 BamO: electron transfer flavoprotein, beta subunit [Desulfococcus multivorans]AQV01442.1 electron transfer flavoprotein subunit beta [Desulfococcus multivorans]EPR40487.1 Electron transfer flavoprotein alpha/beta-subunit [Desulfococcus multivorans DSM 2059]SKA26302.1 electron transfer flavoprotein beta subunit [Desulfococcus multivorans DSM 2059]